MTVREALEQRDFSNRALREALAGLPQGPERRAGIREAREAGVTVIELADMLDVSRQRVYELLS